MAPTIEKIEKKGAVWDQLETETFAPTKFSNDTLLKIIKENKDTVFGVENDFQTITAPNFKDRLPLTKYDNFEKYIDRIEAGEDNVLSAREVKYFLTTSGTTGKSKLIPGGIGNHDSMDQLNFLNQQHDSYGVEGPSTLLLVNKPPLHYDNSGKNRMIGPFTGVIMKTSVDLAISHPPSWKSLTPPHIHLLENYDDFCYLAALYALKVPHLKVMRTTFLPNLLSFYHTVRYKWNDLINDIRSGTISHSISGLTDEVIEGLRKNFMPDPTRAQELEEIFALGAHDGFINRLWPQLRLVACVTGGSFNLYVPRLKTWIGDDVIVYSPFMLGSEGFYGANLSPGEHESLYHPTIKLTFFEFIEEREIDSANPTTLGLEELRVGGRYELVITNNGLYRFRMGDVIEIKSYHNKMPLFDMCYRLGSVINMVGEKTSEGHLVSVLQKMDIEAEEHATHSTEGRTHKSQLIDYTTSVDMTGSAPQYIIYVELAQSNICIEESSAYCWSSEKFDRLLMLANDQYAVFRGQGRLLIAQLRIVSSGLFDVLCALARAKGTSEVQFKVPRLLTTEEQRSAVNAKVLRIV